MNLPKHFRELLEAYDPILKHGFFLLEDLAEEDNHHPLQVNHLGCALFLAFYLFLAWPLCLLTVGVEVDQIQLRHPRELNHLAYEFEGALVLQRSKHFVLYPWEQDDMVLQVGSFATSYQEPHAHGLPTHLLDLGDDLMGA